MTPSTSPTSKSRKKATAPMTRGELIAFAGRLLEGRSGHAFVPAIEVCLARGDSESAMALAAAAPPTAAVLAPLARAGLASGQALLDAILSELAAEPSSIAAIAIRARACLPEGALEELDRAIHQALWEGGIRRPSLEHLGLAYLEAGDVASLEALVERRLEAEGEIGDLIYAIWGLAPERVIELIPGNLERALRSPHVDLAPFEVGQLASMADAEGRLRSWARMELARRLVADGRLDDARALLEQDPAWDTGLHAEKKRERLRLLGDHARADALVPDEPPAGDPTGWALARFVSGRPLEELWPVVLHREEGSSLMAPVQRAATLAAKALDHDPAAEVLPGLDAAERLLADPFRTPYDRGVEGVERQRLASLRERAWVLRGDVAAARAQVEADYKAIKSALGFGWDATSKADIAKAFARRAGAVGLPEIARKAAMKVSAKERVALAADIARFYLPDDVRGATVALQKLAKEHAGSRLAGPLLRDLLDATYANGPGSQGTGEETSATA